MQLGCLLYLRSQDAKSLRLKSWVGDRLTPLGDDIVLLPCVFQSGDEPYLHVKVSYKSSNTEKERMIILMIAANPASTFLFHSESPWGRVAELGSLGGTSACR